MPRAVLTPEHLARLEAMLPELRPLFEGDGVSRHWLHERTGIPVRLLTQWLTGLPVIRAHGRDAWRFPNVQRLRSTLNERFGQYAS